MADRYLVTAADVVEMPEMPEGRKRRIERDAKLLEEKKAAVLEVRKANREKREALKQRTLKYLEEYKTQETELRRLTDEAKAAGGFYRPAEPKVMFVIRIKGVNKIAPKPRKVFHLMRLLQIHNGVFIKVNKATMNMLKLVEPFVTYGYPSVATIRKLVYTRGYLRMGPRNRERVRIQNNTQIDEKLGQHGIHGIEDIVHEIATAGPKFKEVTNALWTFKLRPPRGGFICKRHGFAEMRKGDWGNREDLINKLVKSMI